jgi:Tol biopolymer transport system component
VVALFLGACDDSTGPSNDKPGTVALVTFNGTKPNLFIQNIDGGKSQRIHFNGAVDPIPGNNPLVPPVTDDNLLALAHMSWSPDGTRMAVVATVAFDQSEVVVMNADGSSPRIASVNQQIILSPVDWSPNQRYLAYAMSTQGGARGVEIFTTDLDQNSVKKLTTGSNFGGSGAALRLNADASKVFYSKTTGEVNTPVHNYISELRSVDLNSNMQLVASAIVGEINAIARDGSWVVLIRNLAGSERQLVKREIASGQETVLVNGGKLQRAELVPGDQSVLVVVENGNDPANPRYSSGTVPIQGGSLQMLNGVDSSVTIIAVHPTARVN